MKQINRMGPGLVIGLPTLGRLVNMDWALSLKGMNPPINFNVNFAIIRGQQVADARNAIAKGAVESGAKYLFFLGDDVVCPPHTIRQLIYRIENTPGIGVVGGVYCSKGEPAAPLVFRDNGVGSYWDWKVGEFFECTGLGMDCTLINTDVFRSVSEPWFKTVDSDNFLEGVNSAECWTEDLYFLNKVSKETGYKIYCDGSIICDHWDVYNNKKYTLPHDSLPMRHKLTFKDKKCLMLGPLINMTDESFDITRVAEDEFADYRCDITNLPFADREFDWVIITDKTLNLTPLAEWERVTKMGGKISINCHEYLDKTVICKHITNAVEDGTFVTINK